VSLVGVVTAVTSEIVGAVKSTVKDVIVREPLKFVSEFSLLIVLVTVIVQSVYVPSLRELKMMGLLPEIAMVVLEEQEPPKVMAPDWVELNV
jgi:hypothetical protein